jgi:hypothetical protein
VTRRRDKRPRAVVPVAGGKRPVIAPAAVPQEDQRPIWRFAWLDYGGPWGWNHVTPGDFRLITDFLKEMEALSWREIWAQQTGGGSRRGAKHKFIPMGRCATEGQRRLRQLRLDEHNESWFRFRLGGELRLWGIVLEGQFYLVWWETDHSLCEAEQRHT